MLSQVHSRLHLIIMFMFQCSLVSLLIHFLYFEDMTPGITNISPLHCKNYVEHERETLSSYLMPHFCSSGKSMIFLGNCSWMLLQQPSHNKKVKVSDFAPTTKTLHLSFSIFVMEMKVGVMAHDWEDKVQAVDSIPCQGRSWADPPVIHCFAPSRC